MVATPPRVSSLVVVAFCIALGTAPALAGDLYVAQNAAGSANASSCANAWSIATLNSAGNWGDGTGQVSGGDTVRLCGTIISQLRILGSGSSGAPITITAEPGSKFSRTHWTETAILADEARSWIVIDGLRLEATASGTGKNAGYGRAMDFAGGCSNCEIRNNTVANWYVRTANSSDQGGATGIMVSGGSNLRIYGNTVEHTDMAFMYMISENVTASNVEIYNNIARHTAACTNLGSGGNNAVLNGAKWYGNTCEDLSNWSGCLDGGACQGDVWYHCDGLHVWAVLQHSGARITGMQVYNNTFIGPTCVTSGVGSTTSGWIFIEGSVPNALVYNNLIRGGALTNGHIFLKHSSGKQVYNNTIIGDGASTAVWLEATTSAVIKNNLIVRTYRAIGRDAQSSYASVDYNAYADVVDPYNPFQDSSFMTFSGWQARGFDVHGFEDNSVDQTLDANYKPVTGSRLINAATNVSSACPGCSTDRAGVTRGSQWTIGAYEGGAASGTPAAPTGVRVIR
jgi:hypothetical protein